MQPKGNVANQIAEVAQTTMQFIWQPPPNGAIKINWDASINSEEGCIGLGIVAWDCMGGFLGARSMMQPVVVDPMTTEAMATLWAMQFSKEEGFFEVIFEGDAAYVVFKLHSDPPYLSKIGHFIKSIIQELQGLRSAQFFLCS
jgi:hypothetical protein